MKNEKNLLKTGFAIKGISTFIQVIALVFLLISVPIYSSAFGAIVNSKNEDLREYLVVTGKVVDTNGEPLPGVTITVKSSNIGTVSDIEGNYSIDVAANATLVFSYIGFETQEVNVGNQSTINITLNEDIGDMDEFVVTSLGVPKEPKALGYATTTIKSQELVKVGTPNIATSLYGKAPGVRIQSGAGGATSAVNITIRGINSITGRNQPLIILDGVPIRNEEVTNNNYWGDQRLRGNGLLDINPEDIAELTVLKGASAAALYGSEAVNGVIMITTKKDQPKDLEWILMPIFQWIRLLICQGIKTLEGQVLPIMFLMWGRMRTVFSLMKMAPLAYQILA